MYMFSECYILSRGVMLVQNTYSRGLGWPKELGLSRLKPGYSTDYGALYCANAIDLLTKLPTDSVDLVMTSPPFALTRKKEYGNEPIDRYLEWFMPFCLEIHRILKPTGSFVLDIGGAWIPGAPVRSVYHFGEKRGHSTFPAFSLSLSVREGPGHHPWLAQQCLPTSANASR